MTALEGAKLGSAGVSAPTAPDRAPGDGLAPGDGPAPGDARAAPDQREQRPDRQAEPVAAGRPLVLRAVGLGLSLLGVFLLGLAAYLYGLSGLQEARTQTTLYTQLRTELANAVAPVGPTTPGAPVAILNIPSLGIRDLVVVEGTSSENLMSGPGHLRNTPLPGQGGISEIYGRRATFGGPFARLAQLRPGDKINVITGQGQSSYTVKALGSSRRLVEDPAANRLLLLTAASPVIPAYFVYVDADLTSSPQPSPGNLPDIGMQETALSGDTGSLALAMLWALALVLISAAATFGAIRWSPLLTYLAIAPVLLAVLWSLYQSLAALLPNVY